MDHSSQKTTALQHFVTRSQQIFALPLPKLLKSILNELQNQIYRDYSLSMKNIRKSQRIISNLMVSSFQNMNKNERLEYYMLISDFTIQLAYGKTTFPFKIQNDLQGTAYVSHNSDIHWKKKQYSYDRITHFLNIIGKSGSAPKKYDLRYYFLRKSRNQKYYGLVLQAFDHRVSIPQRIVRLGFNDEQLQNQLSFHVKESIKLRLWQFVKSLYTNDACTKNTINSIRKKSFRLSDETLLINQNVQSTNNKENINIQNEMSSKKVKNKSEIKNEGSNIQSQQQSWLQIEANIVQGNISYILKKNNFNSLWKLSLQLKQHRGILQAYLQKISETIIHQQVRQDNILIITKRYSKLCRPRYFIFKRQMKQTQDLTQKKTIIIQKGINQKDSLFLKQELKGYVKGNIFLTTTFVKSKQQRRQFQKLQMQLMMDNGGYLNQEQNSKMNLEFIRGIITSLAKNRQKQNEIGNIYKPKYLSVDSIQNENDQSVKICKQYMRNKYQVDPFVHEKKANFNKLVGPQWKRDNISGGLIYLNQEKISQQKNVIKYLLTKMGKNLFTGKSILNISLPAHIFSSQSNLQRILHSVRLAPYYIQETLNKNNLQILAYSGLFSITTCLLYLSQEKSFNPIIGQTCQMWIEGCPCYAEQISHHPPISSILMVGKGYKVYGQLQSKVELHLNSGKGSNDGPLIIQFENGDKIVNFLPKSQVSGLSYGQRKFKLIETSKHMYFGRDKVYLMEIKYGNLDKNRILNFGSIKQHPQDHFESYFFQTTHQVSQQEQNQILQYFLKQRKFPNKIKISKIQNQQLSDCKFSGIWSQQVTIGKKKLNLQNIQTTSFQHDNHPLPSDSVWREDIYWRRKNEIDRSQKFKQILQQKQRRDKKLRAQVQP